MAASLMSDMLLGPSTMKPLSELITNVNSFIVVANGYFVLCIAYTNKTIAFYDILLINM